MNADYYAREVRAVFTNTGFERQARYDARFEHLTHRKSECWGLWAKQLHKSRTDIVRARNPVHVYVRLAVARAIRMLHLPRNVGTHDALARAISIRIGYQWWERHAVIGRELHYTHGTRLKEFGPRSSMYPAHSMHEVCDRWARVRGSQLKAKAIAKRQAREALQDAQNAVREINSAIEAVQAVITKGNDE